MTITHEYMKSGVYTITTKTGRIYVGSAVNFRKRWDCHRRDLRLGKHHNKILQDSYLKYGSDSLRFDKIIFCPRDLVLVYEQLAMDAISPNINHLKIAGSTAGNKMPDEAKERLRKLATGRKHTAESREKMRAAQIGRTHSQESKQKISAALKGKVRSAEHAENIRIANSGRKHSPDHRSKISEAGKGRKWTEEMRAKLTGVKHSPETIEKMRAAHLERWKKRKQMMGA